MGHRYLIKPICVELNVLFDFLLGCCSRVALQTLSETPSDDVAQHVLHFFHAGANKFFSGFPDAPC